MCICTPNIITPFCGNPGCTWPEKPTSAEIRENELLRRVAECAIRLRHSGRMIDEYEINMDQFYDANPHISKSGTMGIMMLEAHNKLLSDFDNLIVEAVVAGMDWTKNHGKLGPILAGKLS